MQQISQDPIDNAIVRTTCVATRLSGGHANNALPQTARANVNCRILPGHSPEEVRQELVQVVADPTVKVRYYNFLTEQLDEVAPNVRGYAPPPLRPDVLKPLEKIAAKMWPGAPIVPSMAVGASDSIYTNAAGLPTYMVSGSALARDDVRAHGQDERLSVQAFYDGVDFYYDVPEGGRVVSMKAVGQASGLRLLQVRLPLFTLNASSTFPASCPNIP